MSEIKQLRLTVECALDGPEYPGCILRSPTGQGDEKVTRCPEPDCSKIRIEEAAGGHRRFVSTGACALRLSLLADPSGSFPNM